MHGIPFFQKSNDFDSLIRRRQSATDDTNISLSKENEDTSGITLRKKNTTTRIVKLFHGRNGVKEIGGKRIGNLNF